MYKAEGSRGAYKVQITNNSYIPFKTKKAATEYANALNNGKNQFFAGKDFYIRPSKAKGGK